VNRPILTLIISLAVVHCAFAESDSPLEKAKAEYQQTLAETRKQLTEAIDSQIKSARESGLTEMVQRLSIAKSDFLNSNTLPRIVSLRAAVVEYRIAATRAQEKVLHAFDQHIAKATRSAEDDLARQLAEQKTAFRQQDGIDPIRFRLDAALESFDDADQEAKDAFLQSIEIKRTNAQRRGDINLVDRFVRIKSAFLERGHLPDDAETKMDVLRYNGSRAKAYKVVSKAYETAIKQYTIQGQLDLARTTQLEYARFGRKFHATDASKFNGHFYKFFEERVTWHEAKRRCEDMGGYLVCIANEEENRHVTSISKGHTWIGATDQAQEGVWQWVDGSPMNYTNWWGSTPDNYRGLEHFAETNRGGPGLWNDRWSKPDPDTVQGFVCEWDD